MTIRERYEDIVQAACAVFAKRGFHQASIREIAQASGLSLAGLYHYVGGKDELLFLVLDQSLDTLLRSLDGALAGASTPEGKLLALVQAHLDFALRRGPALKIINRDYELLGEPRRAEVVAKRQSYLDRGLGILRELDPHGRSDDELLSATNLLLGMLNGIATRPFLRSGEDGLALARQVGDIFLYGFLGQPAVSVAAEPAILAYGRRS